MVIPDDAYGGTYRLFAQVEEPWGLPHTSAPVSDLDAIRAAIRPGETKLVWVETPTNPLLNIGDIEALAVVAHDAGALLVVDNTFASPYLQQPLSSAPTSSCTRPRSTAAATPTSSAARSSSRTSRSPRGSPFHQNAIGAVAGPFDAWLTLRGLKTLAVRMDRHCDNAERVVEFLAAHPAVVAGLLPGPRGPSRATRWPRAR